MTEVVIGLGTNQGDLEANLHEALRLLGARAGNLRSVSSFYRTHPWGFQSENMFLNAVAIVDTDQSPGSLLDTLQLIEWDMGRRSKSVSGQYSDRIMDLDILFYGNLVMDTTRLRIPHPLLQQRLFVMDPLVEVCPQRVHPILKQTVFEIREDYLRKSKTT